MNKPPENPDPMVQCLTEEAGHLPRLAAQEARQARTRRLRYRRQLLSGLAVTVLGLCAWQGLHLLLPPRAGNDTPSTTVRQQPATGALRPGEFVKIQTLQEIMSEPVRIPPGASDEQKSLLEAARGQPLLLVMDDSGKLARIYVVER